MHCILMDQPRCIKLHEHISFFMVSSVSRLSESRFHFNVLSVHRFRHHNICLLLLFLLTSTSLVSSIIQILLLKIFRTSVMCLQLQLQYSMARSICLLKLQKISCSRMFYNPSTRLYCLVLEFVAIQKSLGDVGEVIVVQKSS